MSKRRRRSKVDATGRSEGHDRFVKLDWWLLDCAAWKALPHAARSLYVEFKRLYNGRNNGDLHMSVREAAKCLDVDKSTAQRMLGHLQAKLFIGVRSKGTVGQAAHHATTWVLAEYPCDGRAATKAFMSWRPGDGRAAEEKSPYAKSVRDVRIFRTPEGRNDAPRTQNADVNRPKVARPRTQNPDTYNLPSRGGGRAAARSAAVVPEGQSKAIQGVVVAVAPVNPGDNRANALNSNETRRDKPECIAPTAAERTPGGADSEPAPQHDVTHRHADAPDPELSAVFSKQRHRFGPAFRDLRERRGVSREWLAEQIRISPASLERVEAGVGRFDSMVKRRIYDAFREMNGSAVL